MPVLSFDKYLILQARRQNLGEGLCLYDKNDLCVYKEIRRSQWLGEVVV